MPILQLSASESASTLKKTAVNVPAEVARFPFFVIEIFVGLRSEEPYHSYYKRQSLQQPLPDAAVVWWTASITTNLQFGLLVEIYSSENLAIVSHYKRSPKFFQNKILPCLVNWKVYDRHRNILIICHALVLCRLRRSSHFPFQIWIIRSFYLKQFPPLLLVGLDWLQITKIASVSGVRLNVLNSNEIVLNELCTSIRRNMGGIKSWGDRKGANASTN